MSGLYTWFLTFCVVYGFSLAIYRLRLHPLANYPGPFLAKVTQWYDFYHAAIAHDRHEDQLRCQKLYGDTYRYGPNYLIINNIEALKDIYADNKAHIQKGVSYTVLHVDGISSVHTTINKGTHAAKRRVLNHAFSQTALQQQEPLMISEIDQWLEALGKSNSFDAEGWTKESKNMMDWCSWLALDILGQLCFGSSFGMISGSKMRSIAPVLLERANNITSIGGSPLLPLYKMMQRYTPRIERILLPRTFATLQDLATFATTSLKSRLRDETKLEAASSEPPKDFVHYLAKAQDPVTGRSYSQAEMVMELRFLIVAGSDTTATTLSAVLFYLAHHPRCLTRVQEELRRNFVSVEKIRTGALLSSCRYLRAVIDEALRLNPAVPSSLHREVSEGGQIVDMKFLPAGTNVGCSAFAIMRDERYYRDALTFKPERWLPEESTTEQLALARAAFCPFSLGSRGCVGKNMAYQEASISLGRALWKYDIRCVPGDKTGMDEFGTYKLTDYFVSGRDGPLLEFRVHVSKDS